MIYLGADHGGYELKHKIKMWLEEWKEKYEDLGNKENDGEDDYPQFAFAVAQKVAMEEINGREYPFPWKDRPKGILICRSAVGMVVAANKVKGAKTGAIYDERMARLCREHNDVNIIALSGDNLSDTLAKRIIRIWLDIEFSGEPRHLRRVLAIKKFESGK